MREAPETTSGAFLFPSTASKTYQAASSVSILSFLFALHQPKLSTEGNTQSVPNKNYAGEKRVFGFIHYF